MQILSVCHPGDLMSACQPQYLLNMWLMNPHFQERKLESTFLHFYLACKNILSNLFKTWMNHDKDHLHLNHLDYPARPQLYLPKLNFWYNDFFFFFNKQGNEFLLLIYYSSSFVSLVWFFVVIFTARSSSLLSPRLEPCWLFSWQCSFDVCSGS